MAPAKSKVQQRAAGAALREKRGGPKANGAGHQMAQCMTETELKHLAGTSQKKLPARKKGK